MNETGTNEAKSEVQALHALQMYQADLHQGCWVCDAHNPLGLAVDFRPDGNDAVVGIFDCAERYRSYSGTLHGGVVASLLDGAMTTSLMTCGVVAMTADLSVRYRQPVRIGIPAEIRARRTEQKKQIQIVSAELRQNGVVCATATARFLPSPSATGSVRVSD